MTASQAALMGGHPALPDCESVRMLRLFCCCVLVAAVWALPESQAHGQAREGDDFKNKMLAEWKSLLGTVKTVRWESRTEYHSGNVPAHLRLERIVHIQHSFNRNSGNLWLIRIDRLDDKRIGLARQDEQLYLSNKQYTAQLRKPKAAGKWVLTSLEKQRGDFEELFSGDVCFPWMTIGNMRLDQSLLDPTFVINRIEELPAGQSMSPSLRIHFMYNGSRGETSDFVKSGYIDFEPSNSYRPKGYRFNRKSPVEEGFERGILEYEESRSDPVLKSIIVEQEIKVVRKGLIFGKESTMFSQIAYNIAIPDEEFCLSFYGLPEPPGLEWKRPTPWYLWVGLAGIVCLVLGVGGRWLKQRMTASKR